VQSGWRRPFARQLHDVYLQLGPTFQQTTGEAPEKSFRDMQAETGVPSAVAADAVKASGCSSRTFAREDVEMAVTRTHFAFRIDLWDTSGENLVEHIAGVEDYQVAQATYRAAIERWPGAAITLRQGGSSRTVVGRDLPRGPTKVARAGCKGGYHAKRGPGRASLARASTALPDSGKWLAGRWVQSCRVSAATL
jgi:hypothetical protein